MAVRNEFLKWIAALSQWQTRTSYCYRCIVWSSSEWQPKTIRSVVSTLVAEGEPKPGFQPSRVTTFEASSPTIGSLLRTVSNTDEHAPAIMPHTTTSTSDVVPRRPSESGYGTSRRQRPAKPQRPTQSWGQRCGTSQASVVLSVLQIYLIHVRLGRRVRVKTRGSQEKSCHIRKTRRNQKV